VEASELSRKREQGDLDGLKRAFVDTSHSGSKYGEGAAAGVFGGTKKMIRDIANREYGGSIAFYLLSNFRDRRVVLSVQDNYPDVYALVMRTLE
jgi:hypothetical protein